MSNLWQSMDWTVVRLRKHQQAIEDALGVGEPKQTWGCFVQLHAYENLTNVSIFLWGKPVSRLVFSQASNVTEGTIVLLPPIKSINHRTSQLR